MLNFMKEFNTIYADEKPGTIFLCNTFFPFFFLFFIYAENIWYEYPSQALKALPAVRT